MVAVFSRSGAGDCDLVQPLAVRTKVPITIHANFMAVTPNDPVRFKNAA
jgi:hypothetical protein